MNNLKSYAWRLRTFVGSPAFFNVIVVLLIIEAGWIALSGRFPMAFDEDFHFGVIKLYAHHLNPFWNAHPAGADAYGAVTRDPSYLYHYLMSFPLRLISLFTSNQQAQIIGLRIINIGLLASSLPLYKRLLRRTGAAASTVNLVLLLFVLIPIVPFLAAQINYDNLILSMTALSLLLVLKLDQSLQKASIDVKALIGLLSVCVLSSLVKYAYLPIFIAIAGFIGVRIWQTHRTAHSITRSLKNGWNRSKGLSLWLSAVVLVVASVLFVERYGVNLARYHTPVPDCAQVLIYDQCQHYGPWIRDYNFSITKPAETDHNPIHYSQHWLYGMWFRSFFAVDGPRSMYETRGPLTLPAISAIALGILGIAGITLAGRRTWRIYKAPTLWLLVVSACSYGIVLWLSEYKLFIETGQPVAINGRYLLPVLPPVMLIFALTAGQLMRARNVVRYLVATLAILAFVWGGGAFTYILRSNDNWYWQVNPVKSANHVVQKTIGPLTPGINNLTQYLH